MVYMQPDAISYYFCHVTAAEEGRKIYEFTSNLEKQYLEDISAMRKKYTLLANAFVNKNHGLYINAHFLKRHIDDIFDYELLDNPAFKAKKDYCRPLKILTICEKRCIIPFLSFPNGDDCYDWKSLKNTLQHIDYDTYYVQDTKGNRYTGEEFITYIETSIQ